MRVILVSLLCFAWAGAHPFLPDIDYESNEVGTFSGEDGCTNRPSGVYGDDLSCRHYWICRPNTALEFSCQPGFIWNDENKVCDKDDGNKCDKISAVKGALSCKNKVSGSLHAHPNDCSKYYVCEHWFTRMLCPANTLWDERNQRCDSEKVVKCTKGEFRSIRQDSSDQPDNRQLDDEFKYHLKQVIELGMYKWRVGNTEEGVESMMDELSDVADDEDDQPARFHLIQPRRNITAPKLLKISTGRMSSLAGKFARIKLNFRGEEDEEDEEDEDHSDVAEEIDTKVSEVEAEVTEEAQQLEKRVEENVRKAEEEINDEIKKFENKSNEDISGKIGETVKKYEDAIEKDAAQTEERVIDKVRNVEEEVEKLIVEEEMKDGAISGEEESFNEELEEVKEVVNAELEEVGDNLGEQIREMEEVIEEKVDAASVGEEDKLEGEINVELGELGDEFDAMVDDEVEQVNELLHDLEDESEVDEEGDEMDDEDDDEDLVDLVDDVLSDEDVQTDIEELANDEDELEDDTPEEETEDEGGAVPV